MVTAFWGASYYYTDLCLTDLPPMNLTAFRFLSAFLILGIIFFPQLHRISRITWRYSLLIGLALVGTYIFYGYGISRTSLSNAGFICALPVVFTPLFDFIIHRHNPGKKFLLCLILCSVGLAMLTWNDHFQIASGDLLCLGVPVCYSIDLLLTEKAVKNPNVDAIGLGVCQLGVVGVITLALSLLLEQPHLPTTPATWCAALFLGLLCTGIAFVIQSVEQQYTSANHVGLIFTLEPVFSAAMAYFLAHERLLPRGYAGMALMLFSLIWMETDFSDKQK